MWKKYYCPGGLVYINHSGILIIFDKRESASKTRFTLTGIEKVLYEFCDEAHSEKYIHRELLKSGIKINMNDLETILDKLVEDRLMMVEDDWYLSLAVSIEEQASKLSPSNNIKQIFADAYSEIWEHVDL